MSIEIVKVDEAYFKTDRHINSLFPGRNFVTPFVEKRGFKGDYAWELSRGVAPLDPQRRTVRGVTVRTWPDGDETDLCKLFDTRGHAVGYIDMLGRKPERKLDLT